VGVRSPTQLETTKTPTAKALLMSGRKRTVPSLPRALAAQLRAENFGDREGSD